MKSNVCELRRDMSDFDIIPEEAEKVAVYNKLSDRQARRLRLLAEELIGMMPSLLKFGSGRFWIETDGSNYELHVSVVPENIIDVDREKILGVSKSGKNAAAKGIINKICLAVELMMVDYSAVSAEMPVEFYNMGMVGDMSAYNTAWSLANYKEQTNEKEEWDEMEKSIIGKLADDVLVGITGKKIDVIVKKSFYREEIDKWHSISKKN